MGRGANREIQQEKQRRANARPRLIKRAATAAANKARQDKLDAETTADKNAIKVMKMSYAA